MHWMHWLPKSGSILCTLCSLDAVMPLHTDSPHAAATCVTQQGRLCAGAPAGAALMCVA